MSIWRPDPTFYPSPRMAMNAPAEKLAYVAMVNGNDNGRHDAMGVVDVDPGSSGYGHLVGQVDWMSSAYHPGHSCFTSRRWRVARHSRRRNTVAAGQRRLDGRGVPARAR